MSIAESLRAEILRVLTDAKEFTPATCQQIARLAQAGKAVLQASAGVGAVGGIAQLDNDYGSLSSVSDDGSIMLGASTVLSPAPAVETFGVKVIQEVIAALPKLLGQKAKRNDDPLALVRAIKEAKAAGYSDIARTLEERLTGLEVIAEPPVVEVAVEESAPITEFNILQQQTRQLTEEEQRELRKVHFGTPGVAVVPVISGGSNVFRSSSTTDVAADVVAGRLAHTPPRPTPFPLAVDHIDGLKED